MRFVLWDLDGTLLDSGDDIVRSANEARRALGFEPLDPALVRGYVGEGAPRLMQRVMGEDADPSLHRAGLERFLAIYGDHLADATRPYPGLDALVRRFAGRQAVVTNKPGDLARRLVRLVGWEGLFTSVVGGDDVPAKKPAPDMVLRALALAGVPTSEAVLVGDTVINLATAANAGVEVIAVSWGLRPREELLGAPRLVDTPEQLAAALGA